MKSKLLTLRHPSADEACRTCRGRGFIVQANGEFAKASKCECVTRCPLCNDQGFMKEQTDKGTCAKHCACSAVNRRIRQFTHAQIPSRHHSSSLGSFEVSSSESGGLVEGISQYTKTFQYGEENRGLILYGDVGRGKTHLMVAVLRELIFSYGTTARFVEFSHLLADLKSHYGRRQNASSILEPLVRVDVLAIDELGKGRNTEWEGTVLDELISRRYNANRTTFATTNFALGRTRGVALPNLTKPETPALVDRVGERIYSRLVEMCDFLPVRGEDYRTRRMMMRKTPGEQPWLSA
jgi:DNA replication protein DnaC